MSFSVFSDIIVRKRIKTMPFNRDLIVLNLERLWGVSVSLSLVLSGAI